MTRRASILKMLLAPFALKAAAKAAALKPCMPPLTKQDVVWILNPEWKASDYCGEWRFVSGAWFDNPIPVYVPKTLSSVTSRKLEGTVPQKSDTRPVKAPVSHTANNGRESAPATLRDRTPDHAARLPAGTNALSQRNASPHQAVTM